jgi:hypothetical protein
MQQLLESITLIGAMASNLHLFKLTPKPLDCGVRKPGGRHLFAVEHVHRSLEKEEISKDVNVNMCSLTSGVWIFRVVNQLPMMQKNPGTPPISWLLLHAGHNLYTVETMQLDLPLCRTFPMKSSYFHPW